ncbi:hypothetical protein SCG7086_AJ_00160 [Chlamydiales bacterium SCGC AG-110-P3]|nr:hypothetical protein SCG7086_AJ_00160 [Chlamydiales bacterium SCGC AG-110-P3]
MDISAIQTVVLHLLRVAEGASVDGVALEERLRACMRYLQEQIVRAGQVEVQTDTVKLLHAASSWLSGVANNEDLIDRINAAARERFTIDELVPKAQVVVMQECIETAAWVQVRESGAPEGILLSLGAKGIPSAREERVLTAWLRELDHYGSQVTIGLFHQGLRGLSVQAEACRRSTENRFDVWELEWQLACRECHLFEKKDPLHQEWVASCVAKGRVCMDARTIVIGDKVEDLGVEAYRIVGEEGQCVLFGCNASELTLRYRNAKEQAWGIPCDSGLEIRSDGYVGVMSRPTRWLHDVKWETRSVDLTAPDLILVEPLCCMLKWFVTQQAAPKHVRLDDLYYEARGDLCTLRPYRKDWLDWVMLETFVRKVVKGNKHVYRHMMTQSGLVEHPASKFLQWAVRETIKAGHNRIDYRVAAADRRIGDGKIVRLAESWAEETINRLNEIDTERAMSLVDLYPPHYWS